MKTKKIDTAEERIREGNKPIEQQWADAFQAAVEAQTAYWDALHDLEELVGMEFDVGAEDLSATTLDQLIADNEKDGDD